MKLPVLSARARYALAVGAAVASGKTMVLVVANASPRTISTTVIATAIVAGLAIVVVLLHVMVSPRWNPTVRRGPPR